MFRKLFGETEEEQEEYLRIRVIATGVAIVALLIDFVVRSGFSQFFVVVAAFMWGWSLMRAVWGVTSILGIFAMEYNWIVTLLILVFFVAIGGFSGYIICPFGVYRYITLISRKGNKDGLLHR